MSFGWDAHPCRLVRVPLVRCLLDDPPVRSNRYEMVEVPLDDEDPPPVNGTDSIVEKELEEAPMPEPKPADPLDTLLADLRALFAEQYRRGERAALDRVLQAVEGPASGPTPAKLNGKARGADRDAILAELGRAGPATIRELHERLGISRNSIVKTLGRARERKLCASADGRWSLTPAT